MRNSSPKRERLILECILWKMAMDIPWYDFPEVYLSKFHPRSAFPRSLPLASRNVVEHPLRPHPEARGNSLRDIPSYQTFYRHCRKWRNAGLLTQILSTLAADLKTRGGFDLAEALSDGRIQFSGHPRKLIGKKRSLKLTLDPDQTGTWQHMTALLSAKRPARVAERSGASPGTAS